MERFVLFCFRSCLKGDGEKDYYDALELDPSSKVTPEIVKRQYKKLSLTLHPVSHHKPLYPIFLAYLYLDISLSMLFL
ncbi:hypothetical protein EON65_43320 [archaeon]|nr:MAG: hypothetical protein EON65_43320 [archaeon]